MRAADPKHVHVLWIWHVGWRLLRNGDGVVDFGNEGFAAGSPSFEMVFVAEAGVESFVKQFHFGGFAVIGQLQGDGGFSGRGGVCAAGIPGEFHLLVGDDGKIAALAKTARRACPLQRVFAADAEIMLEGSGKHVCRDQ